MIENGGCKMAKRLDRQLTNVELELMQLVWQLGECTIRDVFEALPQGGTSLTLPSRL